MSTACVLTTINVPEVLKLYAAIDPSVHFIVVGDEGTPEDRVRDFLRVHVPDHTYLGYDEQRSSSWKCANLIPYRCIQRRNIGFLEALRTGADCVVSIDDDNACLDHSYFQHFERVLDCPFHGIMALGKRTSPFDSPSWFDVGTLLRPQAKHRGIPHDVSTETIFSHVINAKVGVAAGLCLLDPDIDATTRIAMHPEVHQISEIVRAGVVVRADMPTIWNSQNTAIIRKLLPAWGMVPGVGRFDDLYASLVCQRVMREYGYVAHFGLPMVLQQRNEHDLVQDLRKEIDGYANLKHFHDLLDQVVLLGKNVPEDCQRIWGALRHCKWLPAETVDAMLAYVDDCAAVL